MRVPLLSDDVCGCLGIFERDSSGVYILYIYIYMAAQFFEGSVTKPRRTFVTDLVTELCNKTSWLVTHPALHTPRHTPSLHTSDEQTRPVT